LAAEKLEKKERNFKQDLALLSLTALCLYLLLSLVTYSPHDDGWSTASASNSFQNAGGPVGAYLADGLLHALGYLAYIIPLLAAGKVVQIFRTHQPQASGAVWLLRLLGFFLLVFSLAALIELSIFSAPELPAGSGGMIGQSIAGITVALFSSVGGSILLTLMLCIGSMLFWEFSWLVVFDHIGRFILDISKKCSLLCQRSIAAMKSRLGDRKEKKAAVLAVNPRIEPNLHKNPEPEPEPEPKPKARNLVDSVKKQPLNPGIIAADPKVSDVIFSPIKEVKIEPLEKRDTKPSE
jgi:S-DNA-T family DNA segregation ATPase FtsK/SpoIIIE